MADSDALRDALRPDRPRARAATRSAFDALMKEVYTSPSIFSEPPQKFGSRVDDTVPDEGKTIILSSRKMPPDSLIVMDSSIIDRARLGGRQQQADERNRRQQEFVREQERQRLMREAKPFIVRNALGQDAFESMYEGSFDDDPRDVMLAEKQRLATAPAPKAVRAPEKGKRRVSLGED